MGKICQLVDLDLEIGISFSCRRNELQLHTLLTSLAIFPKRFHPDSLQTLEALEPLCSPIGLNRGQANVHSSIRCFRPLREQ